MKLNKVGAMLYVFLLGLTCASLVAGFVFSIIITAAH